MPFRVTDPEFRGRLFTCVEDYRLAKAALKPIGIPGLNMKSIRMEENPPVDMLIKAELKAQGERADFEIEKLKNRMNDVVRAVNALNRVVKLLMRNPDGIPYGTKLLGRSTVGGRFPEGRQFVLRVTPKGYEVEGMCFKSLSAAAQGVSGNQRNGWNWWRTEEGKTCREAFGA